MYKDIKIKIALVTIQNNIVNASAILLTDLVLLFFKMLDSCPLFPLFNRYILTQSF